jgi:hypothetical protein
LRPRFLAVSASGPSSRSTARASGGLLISRRHVLRAGRRRPVLGKHVRHDRGPERRADQDGGQEHHREPRPLRLLTEVSGPGPGRDRGRASRRDPGLVQVLPVTRCLWGQKRHHRRTVPEPHRPFRRSSSSALRTPEG